MPQTDEQQLAIRLEARIADFEKAMDRANRTAAKNFSAIEARGAASAKRLESSMAQAAQRVNARLATIGKGASEAGRTLGIGLAGAVGVGSITALVKMADGYKNIQNSLKVAGLAGKDLDAVYQSLFASAQRNAAPLDALVTLYGRVKQSQTDLKASSADMLTFTDTVAKSIRAGGGSAAEASGALLQLSQAMGGGKIQAEEYNSLIDGARPLLQAAAAGMKEAGGSVSTLTQLVKAGKVSSEAFFRAIIAGAPVLDQQLAGAATTVAQGFIRLYNVLTDAVGKLDQTTGVSKDVVDALNSIATAVENAGSFLEHFGPQIQGAIGWLDALQKKANDAAYSIGLALGGEVFGSTPNGRVASAFFDSTGDRPFSHGNSKGSGSGNAAQDAVIASWIRKRGGTATNLPATTPTVVTVTKPVHPISLADYPISGGSGTGSKKKGRSGRAGGSHRENDYQREITSIKERTAATQAETAAQASVNPLIDDYGYAVEKARAKQDLLSAAQKAGIAITPEISENIEKLSSAYAEASAAADKLDKSQDQTRRSAEEMRDLGKDVLGGFINDLRQGKSASEALADALGKVADKLIDMALDSIFDPKGGGLFAMIGSLFGFKSGGVVKAATGGHVTGPGSGTSDSIPARLSNGEFVVNAAATKKHRALLDAINSGRVLAFANGGLASARPISSPTFSTAGTGRGAAITITSNVTLQAQGGDPKANADLAKQVGKHVEAQMRAVAQSEIQNSLRQGGILSGR